jgi:hypothetical protein
MRERDVEKYLATAVKEAGWLSFKWSSPAHRGVPDRIIIATHGHVFFVEVKTDTGVLSRLQEMVCGNLLAMGCVVYVIRTKKAVDAMIKVEKKRLEGRHE